MLSKRRVVITGLGVISPVGIGVSENWNNIIEARSGICRITHFDPANFHSQIAGEVKNFDPTLYISEKDARHMDRFIQLGIAASIEAISDAGIKTICVGG